MRVFICHTSADKLSIVKPLSSLISDNVECWIDENEILWGDSVTEKVNSGLKNTDFVIVILSIDFLQKNWPQRELNSVLNIEASTGILKVLPLLVGTDIERARIIEAYPLMNDKLYMRWPEDSENILKQIELLRRRQHPSPTPVPPNTPTTNLESSTQRTIYIPQRVSNPSDKEKRDFISAGFKIVTDYFVQGSSQLSNSIDDVDVDFQVVHSDKFVARLYKDGKEISKCKIWTGGFFDANQLTYSSSFHSIDDDSSFNDALRVADNALVWKPSGINILSSYKGDPMAFGHEAASEYLWRLFVRPLE